MIPFISSADDIALIEKEAMYSRQHGHHSYSTSSSSSDVEVTDDNVVNQLIKQVHRLENSAGI